MHQETLWAVVQVWRGIPAGVELHSSERSARAREEELQGKLSLEDEVGVFEIPVPLIATEAPISP